MKKLTKFLALAAVLIAGIMFTGCELLDMLRQEADATIDQWYKYKGGMDIPLGATDNSENDATLADLKNVDLYVIYVKNQGLKVAVETTKETQVDVLGGIFSQSVETTIGSVKQYDKTAFGETSWATLVLTTGLFEECSEPKILKNPNACLDIGNLQGITIQWEKVLKQKIADLLLGDY